MADDLNLRVYRRAPDRYMLWSTRVSDALLDDLTREELVEWYLHKRPDGTRAEIEALVDAADERTAADGTETYEESPDWLAGN
ncbi:hypothetical protein C475_16751 [Halosimplex carlsbadense 2-9-1]|uniref:Uncharacterized protein n=1 Tax=Halosimplex carlsbadense 2-9-1 TaxID=797114 RepID=M0CHJ5_9EURY|nr:hypothetical protein [Halosimplex carlsbadense]ELZ22770.1 hypothetical protein C475_16751 [Halosimplex carlsbadense 2-9-1]